MSGSKSQVANLEGDPLEELGEDGEVEDDGCGEERVLAGVVDDEGVVAAHGDLGGVLVHRALAVGHVGHVLDHDLREMKHRHPDVQGGPDGRVVGLG